MKIRIFPCGVANGVGVSQEYNCLVGTGKTGVWVGATVFVTVGVIVAAGFGVDLIMADDVTVGAGGTGVTGPQVNSQRLERAQASKGAISFLRPCCIISSCPS